MIKKYLSFNLICVALVMAAPAFAGDAVSFSDPMNWSVGDDGSSYHEWDVLTAKSGNAPDVGFNYGESLLSAQMFGFLSGSNNFYSSIYHFDAEAIVEVPSVAGSSGTHVIVQTASTLGMGGAGITDMEVLAANPLGSPLFISYSPFAISSQTFTVSSSMGPVEQVESMYSFMLPGVHDHFHISWTNPVHSSFKALRVDTNAVPEPSTLLLALFGLALVPRRRRR